MSLVDVTLRCILQIDTNSGYYLVDYRRFVDDALGFALTWNYWFNDAVSTASDIIALQLLLQFWTDNFPGWAISLIFLIVVIALNVLSVRVYGEVWFYIFAELSMEYTKTLGRSNIG